MLTIFDCDGVLVDSEIIASAVDAELLSEAGFSITPEEVTRRFAGLTSADIERIVEEDIGHPLPVDFHERQKRELDLRLANEVMAVAGIHDLLDRLDGPRCICSNSTSDRLRMMLGRTELYDRFQPHIFSAGEVGTGEPKPSPNVYLHAAEAFGVHPRDALVVEDSVFGVTAAKAAGMRVVGFTGGAHTWSSHADILTDAGAETVIHRFADLPAVAEALTVWEGIGS